MELICAECKNKWMPSNRINEVICPYCGNIIGELSRDFSSFEDGIAYIRNMFGDDIFEQRRFFFICTEYCLDYYEKEISAFKILYDSGLSKRILNLRGSDEKIIVRSKKQFVYQLRMKNGMNTSWAEYVIDLFCFATGISTEKEFSSNILSKVRKAENGDPEAQYQVGICYKDGKGVERSLDDAIKWLSLSAGQKYTEAMVALYHIYAKENNKNIAKKYLEEAVNYGNVNAINTLAYCLYHGDDGYKQNIEKAVALLDSGVSQKSIISMRRRADIYLKDGDVERATELLKDAGNMGDIYGVINNRLAVCEGIAKFVKLTLNKLGIECFICGGKCTLENEKIEDHAWNIIKIEEDYYHIDVTWDIRKDDAQNKRIVSYDYFNLDDANISRDHFDFNMSFECTSMLYNYHAIMGRFISGKKQLIQLLSDGLALGKNFSFRIKRTINTPDNIDDIVVETFNESVKYNGTNGKQYYLSANKSQLTYYVTVG